AWRFSAFVASAGVFVAHFADEHFRVRNAARATAWHASLAVALGGFGLALAANLRNLASASGYRPRMLVALVAWPLLTALPAFLASPAGGAARASLPCPPGPAAVAVSDTLAFRPAGTPPDSARPAAADSFNYAPTIQFFDSTGHEPLVVSPPVKLKYQTETEW